MSERPGFARFFSCPEKNYFRPRKKNSLFLTAGGSIPKREKLKEGYLKRDFILRANQAVVGSAKDGNLPVVAETVAGVETIGGVVIGVNGYCR